MAGKEAWGQGEGAAGAVGEKAVAEKHRGARAGREGGWGEEVVAWEALAEKEEEAGRRGRAGWRQSR